MKHRKVFLSRFVSCSFWFQELLGPDAKVCPEEENVEAICQFFNTIGKQLDESPKSRHFNDSYFNRLKELAKNPQLAPRLKFMVRDVLDLRANKWVPRREEVTLSILELCFDAVATSGSLLSWFQRPGEYI